MKKIFILSLIISFFLAIFLSSSYEAKATCPDGFTLDSIHARYTYNQNYFCDVTIWFCCKWDNDLKQVLIEIDDVYNTNTNNCMATIPDWDNFVNWLPSAINKKAYKLCAPLYPPCDDTLHVYYKAIYNIARCWKFENKIIYVGDNVYSLHLYPCSNGVFCKYVYKICTDYSINPPEIKTTLMSKTPIGIPACSTTKPVLPPLNKTWNEPWETECFETECQ